MGNSHNQIPAPNDTVDIRLISSESNWIEGAAIQQLQKTAELNGMRAVAGMPDLHPGRGYPIGAAFFSVGRIYPALVGNDIACGMSFWQTTLKLSKLKLDKLAKALNDVEEPLPDDWSDDIQQGKIRKNISIDAFDRSLGTIGGGNHFAEFQAIDRIENQVLFDDAKLDKNFTYLLVHSGSRGLGQNILSEHITQHNHDGLQEGSDDFSAYMEKHDEAVRWAELNRELIDRRIMEAIRCDGNQVLDVNHNLVSKSEVSGDSGWLHRKGATPSDNGLVIIPGSRGDYSYLVKPIAEFAHRSLFSLAHGAGRKWARGDCKTRLDKRFSSEDLLRTKLGSRVICGDKELLYDEAPEAYKRCDDIIQSLVDENLIEVIARLRPVLTFKTQGRCDK
jgi:release factor H-coupled RctB family protein